MVSKVYVVKEYGGEWEDSWEHIVGVCSSSELADDLKAKIEESHKTSIDEDKWDNMCNVVPKGIYDSQKIVSIMLDNFPEYTEKDINNAMKLYDEQGPIGVEIEEIDFYNNSSDIIANGN